MNYVEKENFQIFLCGLYLHENCKLMQSTSIVTSKQSVRTYKESIRDSKRIQLRPFFNLREMQQMTNNDSSSRIVQLHIHAHVVTLLKPDKIMFVNFLNSLKRRIHDNIKKIQYVWKYISNSQLTFHLFKSWSSGTIRQLWRMNACSARQQQKQTSKRSSRATTKAITQQQQEQQQL